MRVLRDLVGETLSGRYMLVSRVAGGGMGEVFRGHDLLLDRPVAVKVLQPSLAQDPELVERFKEEARAAARLNHPNIVSVHDWGSAGDQTYYMVMEFVSGTDLREVLTLTGPLEPAQAVEVVADVCEALATAHRVDLVHRDVKPENILIARDGTVKVTDFGIAIVIDAERTFPGGTIPGTVRYLSPEQARGEAAVPASDIWAAGALLFELLTGEPLFEGGGIETLQRRAYDNPRLPSELDRSLPRDLDRIVEKACSPDPNERFGDAAEMAQELRMAPVSSAAPLTTLLDDVTGEIRLPDMEPTTFNPRKRTKGRLHLAGMFLAVAALLLVLITGARALMGPNLVRVPAVTGTELTDARARAEELGLKLSVVDRVRTPDVPEGSIVSQDPERGEIEEGRAIEVVVSQGLPLSRVPDLVGLELAKAKDRLDEAKLEMRTASLEYSAKPKGVVIEQDPADGKLEWGQTISVVVSRGPRPIEVPNVTGMKVEEAQEKLREAGFKTAVLDVYSDSVAKGRVVATSPAGGAIAGEGSEIRLQVSIGPEFQNVRLPDVRGMTVQAATAELQSIGLRVRIEESCPGGSTVVETHPIPGTMVKENSVIALFVC